jgi:AraC-like DNA-binding protein
MSHWEAIVELSGPSNRADEDGVVFDAYRAVLARARDLDDMLANPIGRCYVGATFVVWCASPDLQGSIIWGALDETAIRELLAVGELVRHPAIASQRRALTDLSAVERVEPDVLLGFTGTARKNAPWSTSLERHVLVVPIGLSGMMMAGALPTSGADHPVRIAHDVDAAVRLIEHPRARDAYAAASAIVDDIRGSAVLITRLRGHLTRALDSATIDSSAGALGMSTRTLQRQLQQLETSFSDELRKARISTAESLLVHTDLKIEAIATQVGFGTASRMSAYLRRELNVTATELRAARRC